MSIMKRTKFYSDATRNWVIVDAKDKILGRFASRIATILQGKNKAIYSPNSLCGDNVVIINAGQVKVTGKKVKDKIYDKYTGYQSGRKEMNYETLMEKNPTRAVYYAVKGMLPRNSLGKLMLRSLKIYANEVHPHQAQNPKKIEV